MAEESNIREWLENISRDRWLQTRVRHSLGSDWQRFVRLIFKFTSGELSGIEEKVELQVLLNKLKAKNLDDPNIQGLKI